jgi:hypothetical protein
MSDQQIISDADQPAASLETVLAGVKPDQFLHCSYIPEISKWSVRVWGPEATRDPIAFGVGPTLAAALADIHPFEPMKRVRDSGLREWSTEDDAA